MSTQEPQGGRIINNGSISATVPRPSAMDCEQRKYAYLLYLLDSAPYTLSKHAITGLTKAAALDGRKHNIAVCQLDIGTIFQAKQSTNLTQLLGNCATAIGSGTASSAEQANGTRAVEPMISVDYVGEALVYMASMPLHVK